MPRREPLRLTVLSLVGVSLAVPVWAGVPAVVHLGAAPRPVEAEVQSLPLDGVDDAAARSAAAEPDGLAAAGAAETTDVELAALTPPTDTDPFRILGVSWEGTGSQDADGLQAWVRTRADDEWSDWQALPGADDHGPDPGSAEAQGARGGTDPLVVDESDGVQVRVTTSDGTRPGGLRVDLVNPGDSPADATAGESDGTTAAAAAGRPTILTRKAWGADESLKTETTQYGQIKAAFVHHTAGANGYSRGDVPKIIRGIYAYHVKSRGWRDIGYNFVVDKFGRIWEGRYGGVEKPVIGAHTAGHNDDAFAMSTLGTLTTVSPTTATKNAYAKLFAWKLGLHHVDPAVRTSLDGTSFRAVSGHRDAKSTACPGTKLYAAIPSITKATRTAMGASLFAPKVSRSSWAYGTTGGVTVTGKVPRSQTWTLTVASPCRTGTLRTMTGKSTASTGLAAGWDGRLGGALAPPGSYTLTVTTTDGTTSDSWSKNVTVTATDSAPASLCGPTSESPTPSTTATATATATKLPSTAMIAPVTRNEVYGVPASGRFALQGHGWGHGRGMGQYGAHGAASTGLTAKQILAFYYPATSLGSVGNPTMRVLLARDTGYDLWVRAEAGLSARYYPQGSATRVTVRVPDTLAGATVSSWRYRARDMGSYNDVDIQGYAAGAWQTWRTTGQVVGSRPVEWVAGDGELSLYNRGTDQRRMYRGLLRGNRTGTAFQVVNYVALDSYLRSVVPSEMPASWRTEALRAQAIAARTYALAERARRSGGTFDVYDDTRSQVYSGVAAYSLTWQHIRSYEDSRSTEAIAATKGKGIEYRGVPIRSQFSSSNGGATLGDVGGVAWERTYLDPFDRLGESPRTTWTDSVSASSLQARYPSIGTLQRLRVTQRSGAGDWKGRIQVVRLEGTKGRVTLRGDGAVRSAFGAYSSWFTVTK